MSDRTQDYLTVLQRQDSIQHLVKLFFGILAENPTWQKASDTGMLFIPVSRNWQLKEWHAHIVPLWTRQKYNYWLVFHLQLSGFSAYPVDYPVVPKGKSRVRLIFHAGNTEKEVKALATTICEFAQEMINIEEMDDSAAQLPIKVQQMYALMGAA